MLRVVLTLLALVLSGGCAKDADESARMACMTFDSYRGLTALADQPTPEQMVGMAEDAAEDNEQFGRLAVLLGSWADKAQVNIAMTQRYGLRDMPPDQKRIFNQRSKEIETLELQISEECKRARQ